jgi:hypothetical protein
VGGAFPIALSLPLASLLVESRRIASLKAASAALVSPFIKRMFPTRVMRVDEQ